MATQKYVYQKEDNTILGPKITINFKSKQNMTSYEWIYVSKLQWLNSNVYKFYNNKYITMQTKLHCSLYNNNIKATFVDQVASLINK
jgi:hypothetical protein